VVALMLVLLQHLPLGFLLLLQRVDLVRVLRLQGVLLAEQVVLTVIVVVGKELWRQ